MWLAFVLIWLGVLSERTVAQFKPFHACQVRPCYEQSLLTCALRDQPWAALLYNGRPVCVCCSDERDARIAAGSNVMSGKGLFWGNRLKVCETVYIDEITCQARQLRDCNYQTIVYKGTFVGCFYCRALCGTSVDCRDLGRSCGLSKRYQPVRSCTFTPYAVADYDYDQAGLGGLGAIGNSGLGTGLNGGLGNGLSGPSGLGIMNGMSGAGMLNSDANNLLYIKENANNFSASFYMDDEIRNQLLNILKSSNQTRPGATGAVNESKATSLSIENGVTLDDERRTEREPLQSNESSSSKTSESVCGNKSKEFSVAEYAIGAKSSTAKQVNQSTETTTSDSLILTALKPSGELQ